MEDYNRAMGHLLGLPVCTMITTGRTGTDFLQSLLDGHPQVLTFNGHVQFGDFWRRSVCVSAGNFEVADFLDEFIGAYIERFKSRYDHIERKDRLGPDYDQSLSIDTAVFKNHALQLMQGQPADSRHMLLAIYGAYALCLGQDLKLKRLFFHHEHHVEGIGPFLRDFLQSKIICMTRDPRANFVSGVENHRTYDPQKDNGRHVYSYIRRILADGSVLEHLGHPYVVVRLEDLGNQALVLNLCGWLGIDYHECMKESTWGGLLWHGDRLSKEKRHDRGFSPDLLKNKWEQKLPWVDKYVLNFIMNPRLCAYGYVYRPIAWWDLFLAALLIPWPLAFEWRFFTLDYLYRQIRQKQFKRVLSNKISYYKRVILFYRYYGCIVRRCPWTQPLLKAQQ